MRSFLAIELPSRVRERLGEAQEKLKASGADVKWVRPASIHLTLKFLGEIDGNMVHAIRHAIHGIVQNHASFSLEVAGVGCFPRLSQPRVVWVGLHGGNEQLTALQSQVEGAMEALGFDRETRPFRPHLTLGRVRSPRGRDRLVSIIRDLFDLNLGQFSVESIVQFQSELHPTGARYTALWELPLGGVQAHR